MGCDLISEVLHLSAEPDFRDVTLRWEYERHAPKLYGFHVHYCELQAWGPHRCRSKVRTISQRPNMNTFVVVQYYEA